jgi:hypothetical protein
MNGVTLALGLLNVVLGLVYTSYGTMTLVEMMRNRRTMGFSHFGAAWIAMAFTCGPHHWIHGIHLLAEGRQAGVLDLIAVAIGFPAGVIWFLLRVEAFYGGRGDRFVRGTPAWIVAIPTIFAVYLTAVGAAVLNILESSHITINAPVVLNLMLFFLYSGIGYYLARTQIVNRRPLGGFSLSGLSLTIVFPTCAVMHGIFAYYSMTGLYAWDIHNLVIDYFAVPAAVYFLWVVHALYRGTFHDWNGASSIAVAFGEAAANGGAPATAAGAAAKA